MKRWEIWIATVPDKGGHEQMGLRPVVILAHTGISVALIIPLTSNLDILRMPYTQSVPASMENGLDKNSVLLLSQLGAMDIRRLVRRVGVLEHEHVKEVKRALKNLLDL